MKTLDEVIYRFEKEIHEECGFYEDDVEDALHYLKEYRDMIQKIETMREDAKKEIDAIRISAINAMANQCDTCPWRKEKGWE